MVKLKPAGLRASSLWPDERASAAISRPDFTSNGTWQANLHFSD
jgi:hypothetical protein